MFPNDGHTLAFNQTASGNFTPPNNQVDTSVITLIADAPGVSQIVWRTDLPDLLDFFGIYGYDLGDISTGHSFTIVPEPSTAVLIGLYLLAVAGWRRGRD